ncbi:MAG TPA: FAD-dependent oxidoreductase [Xanthomonadales bacterium]|nr:FAD-dependent oxidoreductase [Xanthomonadales bacterium]
MKRIVIIGGGFAGVKCARVLTRELRGSAEVVLFSRDNHMVFQPLLPDVAGSSLNPRAVAPPLRLLLPRVQCRTETVLAIDTAANEVVHESHDGTPRRLRYDHLVVACGNVVNLNGLPGMADHALPLKTIGDAIAMRAHVMQQLEKADLAETAEQRAFYLTFVVVGGGFSGVEVAGELNDLVRHALKHYRNVRAEDVMVTLLHGQAEILPELSPKLRRFAQERMAARGIKLLCEVKAAEVTRRGVILTNGRKVEGATVICTVGTAPNPLVAALDAPKERGRLATDPDMRIPGHANAWAVGDCAIVPNAHDGKAGPPTAQFAEREGCQCARNIARVLRGEATRPFDHKPLGMACGIGGRRGVAELFGLRFSGFVAWWLWRSGFLWKVPSLAQKTKVGIDWAWELVFPRDLSHFRPAQSDPVSRARYAPGEVLFRQGERPGTLWAITAGEAEIVQRCPHSGAWQVLATLSTGAVAGEETLADHVNETVVVRARSGVEAFLLGRESLSRLSAALGPVEAIVQRAVNRPRGGIWRHHPAAMRALQSTPVSKLAMRQPLLVAAADEPLASAYERMAEGRHGCLVVVAAGRVAGVATRTDVLDAIARGASAGTPIGDACNRRPIVMQHFEPASLAAERMADQGLKSLPVVDDDGAPVALVSADDLVAFALAHERAPAAATG